MSDSSTQTGRMPSQELGYAARFEEVMKLWNAFLDFEDLVADDFDQNKIRGRRAAHPPFVPTAALLTASYPLVHIPAEDDTCPICTDAYHTIAEYEANPALAVPQRLPCGHIACRNCLEIWLSPHERKNTCPVCRHECYEARPEEDDLEMLRHLSFMNRTDARRRSPEGILEERRLWRFILRDELEDLEMVLKQEMETDGGGPGSIASHQRRCEKLTLMRVVGKMAYALRPPERCDDLDHEDDDECWSEAFDDQRRSLLETDRCISIVLRG